MRRKFLLPWFAGPALILASIFLFIPRLGAENFSTTLGPGWNLISIPFSDTGMTLGGLFGTQVPTAFSYSRQNGYQAMNASSSLQAGAGFWVLMNSSTPVQAQGAANPPSTPVSVQLTSGWNVIGNPFNTAIDWGHNIRFNTVSVLVSQEIVSGPYAFDPVTGDYSLAVTLEPWKGYWIRTAASGTLTFSTTTNMPPTADAGDDRRVLPGTLATLDGTGSSDPEQGQIFYQWDQILGPSVTLSDSSASKPTFTPTQDGDYVFALTVNDGDLYSLADTVTISVGNLPPVANAGIDRRLLPETQVTLDGTSSYDPEGIQVTYLWTQIQGPAITLSDPAAAQPYFTPIEMGTYRFQLVVNDQTFDSEADQVIITVSNLSPVAMAGDDVTTTINQVVTLDGSGSYDPEGAPITYYWIQTSGVMADLSDPTVQKPTFTVPDYGQFIFRLTVSDGLNESTPDTVTITSVNNPPVADAGTDQTGIRYQTVTLDGSASLDPDLDELTYEWTQTEGEDAEITNSASVTATFIPPTFDVYEFQLRVYDGYQYSAPDSVTVTVDNHPPVAEAGTDISGSKGHTITLNGSGSSDVDGGDLMYFWTQTAGNQVDLTGAETAAPHFISNEYTSYQFSLMVFDGQYYSTPDTVGVIIENHAPAANAGTDIDGIKNHLVSLNGALSSDPDGDPIETWAWNQTAGASVALTGASTPTPTFTPTQFDTYTFSLVVSDASLSSTPDTVNVTVVNHTPVADAGEDQNNIHMGQLVTLNGTESSDTDGDDLSYHWTQTAGASAALSNSTSPTPTFTPTTIETYAFQLVVNDGLADSNPDTVQVTVINQVPVAVASVSPTSGSTPLLAVVNASPSYDLDGTISAYYFDCNNDGVFEQENPSSSPTWTCLYGYTKTVTPKVKVKDNLGAYSETVTLSQVQAATSFDSYEPTNIGYTRDYRKIANPLERCTEVFTHQELVDSDWYYHMETTCGTDTQYMREDSTGLYLYLPDTEVTMTLASYPLTVGKTWEVTPTMEAEVISFITLTVPAGTFDNCARISFGGTTTLFVCKDVGLVMDDELELVDYDFN